MKFPLHILLALSTAILPCRAEELALPDSLHPYNRFHEKAVRIQGLAWIQTSAKLDMVLLITPSAHIWLEPWTEKAAADFQKWNGKLIEVSGILSEGELTSGPVEEEKPAKEIITYYRMSDFTIRGIDRVKDEITIETEEGGTGQPTNRAEPKTEGNDKPQVKRVPAVNSAYVFKPAAITPSPDGEGYNGRFLFINKGGSPLMVNGFDEPENGKFEPRFIRYQTLNGGVWNDLEIGYCGTGAEEFPMKPLKSYEFHASLSPFDEQETPLTGRVGFDVYTGDEGGWVEYWSYPFVLDWKKDRESGEFSFVKKEHIEKLRDVFSKAGFKEELLVGDDFCSRILQSIMKESQGQESATSFKPFLGKLDVTPSFQLDGSIRIDFTSDEVRNSNSEYSGWFRMDPRKFNPKWFSEAVKDYVEVGKWGDDGIKMELDDGSSWDSPLYLSINYVPFEKSKVPTEKESAELFTKMLNVLKKCLKD